jgi:hypothetical protein
MRWINSPDRSRFYNIILVMFCFKLANYNLIDEIGFFFF